MAPTTCRGFSAAMAARNFAPAESWAVFGVLMVGASLAGWSADLDHGAAGHFAVDVGLERIRQLGERDGPVGDTREMARGEIRGDAPPHFEPFGARCCRRVDAEQIHAAQDERQHRGPELRAASKADACDVS